METHELTGECSIVIPGMKLPYACSECPMSCSNDGYEYFCNLLREDCIDPLRKRNNTCPMYETVQI